MAGIALARLSLTPQEFYDLSPVEFTWAIKEKNTIDQLNSRERYEVARYQLLHHWNMKISRPKKLYDDVTQVNPFPWDKAKEVKQQPMHEMKAALKAIASAFTRKRK